MTHRVQYNPYLHVSVMYRVLLEALWADRSETPLYKVRIEPKPPSPPRFTPDREETAGMRERLVSLGVTGGKPLLLLNPNASDMLPLRKWPAERFVELGRRVLDNHDVWILITGAPSESDAAEEIRVELDSARVVNVAGKTSLRELLVLYTLSDLLVTNDSGPSHFSSLTDVHSVVLFGPETPLLYGTRRGNTTIIWSELACSPCVNVFNHRFSPCTDNVCMQSITVDRVYETVRRCLSDRKAHPSARRQDTASASDDTL
jgi:ADP-heptose:LPS heptosyltransferase